ncbi:MAG: enoyl-CoA hydratase/isomerase family protein [Bryobacteraceae bacterium]|nr:enoyl-CoA hydratase/isomerase family protein [Bryobacteraceae bacterium]
MPDSAATPPFLKIDGHLGTILLNRPDHHNRLEPQDLRMLQALFDEVDANEEVRALVIASTGRTFCSGFHLGALNQAESAPQAFEQMTDRLEAVRVPTVCALQGGLYGGAVDLALACDFRVGVPDTELFVPVSRLGIHFYGGGMRRMVQRLGLAAAKRILLSGATLRAPELQRINYLDLIFDSAEFEEQVRSVATTLCESAPIAVQGMKRSLNAICRGDADWAEIAGSVQRSLRSSDFQEGISAWTERRKPVFRGK